MEVGKDGPKLTEELQRTRTALIQNLAGLGILVSDTGAWDDSTLFQNLLQPVQQYLFDVGVTITNTELLEAFASLHDDEVIALMDSQQDRDDDHDDGGDAGVREPLSPRPNSGQDGAYADDDSLIF